MLRLNAIAGVLNADLTVANGFTNNGLIELSSSNGQIAPALHVSAGTLVNAVGAQINILAGTGGGRTLDAQLDNEGTLNLGADLALNKASADHFRSEERRVGKERRSRRQREHSKNSTNIEGVTS